MSMSHKAFVFDHARFEQELREGLLAALANDEARPLEAFINTNREALRDPYEGEPLGPDWRDTFRPSDVQAYADFALTKYYDPSDDLGLGTDWEDASQALAQAGLDGRVLLGTALTTPDGALCFDPGRQGAYFQSEAVVTEHLAQLAALEARASRLPDGLRAARDLLHAAATARGGLYITF
jgi:hypothetical protein